MQRSKALAEIVRDKAGRGADRSLHLDYDLRYAVARAADPRGCSQNLLSGHCCSSSFGCEEVTWAGESCLGRGTVGLNLAGPEVADEQNADQCSFGASGHRAGSDIEMLGCWKMWGKRVGERVVAVHKGVAQTAHCTLG